MLINKYVNIFIKQLSFIKKLINKYINIFKKLLTFIK